MNIIFSEYCGLGNSILLSASFKMIKQNENHHISLVGDDKFGGITINKFNEYLDNKIRLSALFNIKKIFRFISLLRKCDYLIIPAHSNPSISFLIMSYIFLKDKIIFSHNFYRDMHFIKKIFIIIISWFRKIDFIEVEYTDDLHEIKINQKFINKIYIDDKQINSQPVLNYFDYPEDVRCIEKFRLKNKKFIVLQPFCANGNADPKVWPFENFKKLTKIILNEFKDIDIVLVGDDGDKKNFINFIQDTRIINLISKTTIIELITILKNSKFIVCHDSSILHLSDSIGLKNVSLFGPTNFNKNRPNGSNSFYIRKKFMKEILPSEVSNIIKKNIYI